MEGKMTAESRAKIEAEISEVLVDAWAPFGDDAPSDRAAATYAAYAHELYSLLARGASDVQIARRLHVAERDELGHPELNTRDLTPLMVRLREIERRI
jgi:hypothetical protein